MTETTLRARRERALGAGASLFYSTPLHIVRGEGIYLFDAEGRGYVDMYNNVPCVGHAHPHIVDAMARQQSILNVHSRYLHEGIVVFAERLAALHGPQVQSLIFSCTGTEANEIALRMARFATGRRGIVCSDAAYHGNSELVSGLTRVGVQTRNPEVRTFPFPQRYRPLTSGLSEAELADAYLGRIADAIDSLERNGAGLAALIVCPIFANEGLPDVPEGLMHRAVAMVRAAGGLVIADEVQAGYGRTGHWWGYNAAGFTPDIVVTGKSMGAGLPLAATAASKALVDGFRAKTRYFNTYAASPLQAAVGLAVLDVIDNEGLVATAGGMGSALIGALLRRKDKCAQIGDIRGTGLFVGIDMVSDRQSRAPDRELAVDMVNRLKDKGFLTNSAGALGNMVKIRPPLSFSENNLREFLAAFDAVVEEING